MTDHSPTMATSGTDHDQQRSVAALRDCTAFQRDVLWTLANAGPTKGVGIQDDLEAYYEATVHHSRTYSNLDELVDRGLVEKGSRDDRTNEYRLTTAGRRALSRRRAWIEGAKGVTR